MAAWSNGTRFVWVGPEWDYQVESEIPQEEVSLSIVTNTDPYMESMLRISEQIAASMTVGNSARGIITFTD